MYTSLYRRERPEVFDQVIGQEHVVKVLKYQIENQKVSHAYLFCGTRGTGKTTAARLLAKAVNCLEEDRPCGHCANCKAIQEGNFLDVIEIDAASNNGVDNIRELRESVNYPPSQGKRKVYIIDEVHMLTKSGFNALLKTLEEPPEDVMFILATTDPQMMPATVLSRCIRLDFRRVSESMLYEKLVQVCQKEGAGYEEGALRIIVSCADGSVRDALSLMEQVLSSGHKQIDKNVVLDMLGIVSDDYYLQLTESVMEGAVSKGLTLVQQASEDGKDMKQLLQGWLSHMRNLLICQFTESPETILNMSSENCLKIKEQSSNISTEDLDRLINILAKTIYDSKYSRNARIMVEVALVKMSEAFSGFRGHQVRTSETMGRNLGQSIGRKSVGGLDAAVSYDFPTTESIAATDAFSATESAAASGAFGEQKAAAITEVSKPKVGVITEMAEDSLRPKEVSVQNTWSPQPNEGDSCFDNEELPPWDMGEAHLEENHETDSVKSGGQRDMENSEDSNSLSPDDILSQLSQVANSETFEPSKVNKTKLWQSIVAETQKIDKTSSFLAQGVDIIELTDSYCRCSVSSPVKEKLLRKHEKLVANALKKLVGAPLDVLVENQDAKVHHMTTGEFNSWQNSTDTVKSDEAVAAEKLADEVMAKFGMEIDIEQ